MLISHATLGVVKKVETEGDDLLLQIWRNYGQPKIVTKIKSLGELKDLKQKAIDAGVPYYVVCDAGRTQACLSIMHSDAQIILMFNESQCFCLCHCIRSPQVHILC